MGVELTGESWSSWLREVLDRFLNVHFLLTAALISFWLWALTGPIQALIPLYSSLTGDTSDPEVGDKLKLVLDSAIAVSGVFTTVIGVVLGHYFGQRGIEVAERARREAESSGEEVVEDFAEDSEFLAGQIDGLMEALDEKNTAVAEALEIIYEKVGDEFEVEEHSALGRYIFFEGDVEADDDIDG